MGVPGAGRGAENCLKGRECSYGPVSAVLGERPSWRRRPYRYCRLPRVHRPACGHLPLRRGWTGILTGAMDERPDRCVKAVQQDRARHASRHQHPCDTIHIAVRFGHILLFNLHQDAEHPVALGQGHKTFRILVSLMKRVVGGWSVSDCVCVSGTEVSDRLCARD